MIVTISQPAYMPWKPYFERIALSDLHIVLDSVQLEKRGYTHRNHVFYRGKDQWLSIPVKDSRSLTIRETPIEWSEPWTRKHCQTLRSAYRRSENLDKLRKWFDGLDPGARLGEVLASNLGFWLGELEVDSKILYASEMGVKGKRSDLILNLCREVGASTYISGPMGMHYLEVRAFEDAGIEIVYDNPLPGPSILHSWLGGKDDAK